MEYDYRFEATEPIESQESFGNLLNFAEAYVRNYYRQFSRVMLSARDFRYAAIELGYVIEHSEALDIVHRIEERVWEEEAQIRHQEDMIERGIDGDPFA